MSYFPLSVWNWKESIKAVFLEKVDVVSENNEIVSSPSISIKIPIDFVGTPVGVQSEGGVLITSLNELEISCLPGDIPDNIEVDISEVSLGANIQAGDLTLDNNLELVTNADSTIVSVTHAVVEEEPAVEEELEEGMEGEEGEATEGEATEGTEEKTEGSDDNKGPDGNSSDS